MKWSVNYFDQVVSTNETAKNFPINTVVVAVYQSGGKGRMGRTWVSPKGNLYLSAVVKDYDEKTPFIAFVVAVALAEALTDFNVRLKWPNDVLLNGGKLAGVLLERTDDKRVIIGVGVNVCSSPSEGMLYKTASLNGQIGVEIAQEKILNALAENIALFEEKGFDIIREKWVRYVEGIGQTIKVQLPTQTLVGIFKELSPQGELVLELPDKTVQKITAGDVFFI